MIINGGIECGHGYEKPQATNRQGYYKKFAKYFKVSSCTNLVFFELFSRSTLKARN